jgi:hypothetical protein
MTDPEHFLSRWSRRKREAADESDPSPDKQRPQDAADAPHDGHVDGPVPDATTPKQRAPNSEAVEPVFDLSSLPSIESITADTDIRAFLAPGVPAEVRLAALRRAWVADPKVRDFVGLADYDWDFHTPGALPGFGPLTMTDELRREVLRIVGASQAEPESVTPPGAPPSVEPAPQPEISSTQSIAETKNKAEPPAKTADASSAGTDQPVHNQDELIAAKAIPHRSEPSIAARQDQSIADDLSIPARRGHGRALPK